MPKSFSRINRLEPEFKKVIAELVAEYFDASRFGLVTITAVNLNEKMSVVKVYAHSTFNSNKVADELQKSVFDWKNELAKRVRVKYTPQIRFYLDESVEHASRIEELLKQIKKPEN